MDQVTQSESLTVTAYATLIQRAARMAGAAVVEGEAQRPRMTNGGALMFEVTDGESRLPCKVVPWTLRQGITHEPREGDLVRLEVSYPDFWPAGGRLSVVVEDIELAGDGELLKRRQALLKKLTAEGLTDPGQFTTLPRFPRAVGVIAGKDSDALKDVIHCLGERFPAAPVLTACCQVQGAGAPRAVIDALARLDLHPAVDVIIIARGGGSVRDLAAFDDEALCRAIRAIGTPVIAAVGHTDNDPVCNHVTHAAHVPRHAGELAVPNRADLLLEVDEADAVAERAVRRFRRQLDEFEARCQGLQGLARVKAWRMDVTELARIIDAVTRDLIAETASDLAAGREALATIPARVQAHRVDRERQLERFAIAADRAAAWPRQRAEEVEQLAERLTRAGQRVLAERKTNWLRALDRQGQSLGKASRRALRQSSRELDRDAGDLARAGRQRLEAIRRDVESRLAVLAASDLRHRGWLLATGASGQMVTSIADVALSDRLRLQLRDGAVDAVAAELHPETKENGT